MLHAERVQRGGGKKTYRATLSSLPAGTIVEHEGRPHLYWNGGLRPWSFSGYGFAVEVSPESDVEALTPKSIVEAIRAGFVPQVHESAAADTLATTLWRSTTGRG